MFFWKRSADPKAELKSLIGDYELPSFPAVAMSTLSLLRQQADMAEVAASLMTDPGLTVRILRTVNSAAFGMRKRVTNLQYATSLLGRSRVESLVLTAAVGAALPDRGVIDLPAFWRTSARRACLASQIAARVDPGSQVESFTAGLLQDMAVPVLAASHGDRYAALWTRSESQDDVTLQELELDAFGYDHAHVGAVLAESWDLPEALITAISDHHAAGQRAPRAVEAVAHVCHRQPPDELAALRTHCQAALELQPEYLDPIIEAAGAASVSLAESITGSAET